MFSINCVPLCDQLPVDMDYEKKYPITQQPGDFVLARWTRGYKHVEVYYHDQLIGEVQGAAKLKNGVRIQNDLLNTVELRLSEKPIVLDIIVDGFHSPVNNSHPVKELKKSAVFFWMIFAFGLMGSLMEGISVGVNPIGMIVSSINLLIIGVYLMAALTVRKGLAWGYFTGFGMFSLMYVLSLFSLLNPGLFVIIIFLVRTAFLVFLIINMKHAIATIKHKKYNQPVNDLVDRF